jgi:hypothetical protein
MIAEKGQIIKKIELAPDPSSSGLQNQLALNLAALQ